MRCGASSRSRVVTSSTCRKSASRFPSPSSTMAWPSLTRARPTLEGCRRSGVARPNFGRAGFYSARRSRANLHGALLVGAGLCPPGRDPFCNRSPTSSAIRTLAARLMAGGPPKMTQKRKFASLALWVRKRHRHVSLCRHTGDSSGLWPVCPDAIGRSLLARHRPPA